MRFSIILPAVLCALLAGPRAAGQGDAPDAVYLTWQRDPTTTMTVCWLSAAAGSDTVTYRAAGDDSRLTATGSHHELPHTDRLVHVVELNGLTPGTDYLVRMPGDPAAHTFRTLPAEAAAPVTFIVGGDIHRRAHIDDAIYREAAARDPFFAVLGGDIVYDNGEPERAHRWLEWLAFWQEAMVTPAGHLIPMVPAIGNHEVRGRYDETPDAAPFFYNVYPFPGRSGRGALDFGDYLSLIVVDSGHTHPVGGEQTEWLAEALAARRDVPHLFAIYHVPAYPSVRSFDEGKSPLIRRHWVPLFEQNGVDAAFEHHDHAYKRTPPILGGRVDQAGVVYLGDGAWGAPPRGVHRPQDTWYLARANSMNHVIVVTLHGDRRRYLALTRDGVVIDRYPAAPPEGIRPSSESAEAPPPLPGSTSRSPRDP